MPSGAFNICCPRDCVSRHNGDTSGAPLKPLRVDSALRALSSLRGLRGAPKVPPLCWETSVSRAANVGTVSKNGLIDKQIVPRSVRVPVFLNPISVNVVKEGFDLQWWGNFKKSFQRFFTIMNFFLSTFFVQFLMKLDHDK